MNRPILNLDQLELESPPFPGPERYGAKMARIAPRLGAKKLGYNLTVIAPGKAAFPFHNHWVKEELFLVLEGEGEVRIGSERYPLRQGDVLACPPGGKETAHQIVNTSQAELKIFAVSSEAQAELVEYPDTGKFGFLAQGPAGPDGEPRHLRFVSREELGLDYWEGE
ncbi:cupin domain-containing protein [Vulgatibacter sp.]|uniref:cupin domain-containing protein n=1 Tax=Vulgatibacter sp. TaxID=1971226 RepID=UPI003567162E